MLYEKQTNKQTNKNKNKTKQNKNKNKKEWYILATPPFSETISQGVLIKEWEGQGQKKWNVSVIKLVKYWRFLSYPSSNKGGLLRKKYTSGPRYWNLPVLVNTGLFLVYQYCLKNWYLHSLERAGVIQKLTVLEDKNGLVLFNTRVPVSGTWSILFP